MHAELEYSPKFGPNALQGHYQAEFWDDTAGGPDVLLDATGRPFALTGLPPLHREEIWLLRPRYPTDHGDRHL